MVFTLWWWFPADGILTDGTALADRNSAAEIVGCRWGSHTLVIG